MNIDLWFDTVFVYLPFSDFNSLVRLGAAGKTEHSVRWAIGRRTINRMQLAQGDKVLFYRARFPSVYLPGSSKS